MNENSKLLPAIMIVGISALAFAAVGFFISRQVYQETSLGGVPETQEYTATTTALITGTLVKATETDHLIAKGGITFGSLIIASTTAHVMAIYDATSSAAVTDGTFSTLITTIPELTPQGTYTYDVRLKQGLAVKLKAGFAGDYVLTHRR